MAGPSSTRAWPSQQARFGGLFSGSLVSLVMEERVTLYEWGLGWAAKAQVRVAVAQLQLVEGLHLPRLLRLDRQLPTLMRSLLLDEREKT